MDVNVGDILMMKKQHPCGGKRFEVLRVGMDFKIRCITCGGKLWIPAQQGGAKYKKNRGQYSACKVI